MPIYKNWNDFDALRDKNKILVIYGAGENGHRFLNRHKIVPDYFCDKNARYIKRVVGDWRGVDGQQLQFPCLTLKQLLVKLNGEDVDILVSNLDEKIIKKMHKIFDRTNFTKNTVIYFCYGYNISKRQLYNEPYSVYKINNILNKPFAARFFPFIIENFDYSTVFKNLKNAYFDSTFSSIEELKNSLGQKHGPRTDSWFRSLKEITNRFQNLDYKKNDIKAIYFFCDSRFMRAHGFNVMEAVLKENTNHRVENFSFHRMSYDCSKQVLFFLTSIPLIRNSVVIVTRILDPYLLLIAMRYCKKYNCRLIYYYVPNSGIIFRKILSDYEKWCIEVSGLNSSYRLSEEKIKKKIKFVAENMNVEFYEPSEKFFNSDKTIYIDCSHFGDYGAEIIGKHLCDIIKNQPVNSNNDICEDFHIEPEEKIEYANSIIPYLVPDISIYLNDLKKYKQNLKNCGAIVMNCNPFTLGHRYLIEYATSKVEHLYIFVVEEDKSEFPFKDRYKLVKQNTSDLKNVTVLPSSKFIISSQTFDAYFGKNVISEQQAVEQDVSFDLLIFAAAIAPTLNIKTRFVGQEPFDPLTRHYNEEMKKLLPEYGCDVVEMPRLEKDGEAVSASRVRNFLKEGNFDEIRKIVPKMTFRYLRKS